MPIPSTFALIVTGYCCSICLPAWCRLKKPGILPGFLFGLPNGN